MFGVHSCIVVVKVWTYGLMGVCCLDVEEDFIVGLGIEGEVGKGKGTDVFF